MLFIKARELFGKDAGYVPPSKTKRRLLKKQQAPRPQKQ